MFTDLLQPETRWKKIGESYVNDVLVDGHRTPKIETSTTEVIVSRVGSDKDGVPTSSRVKRESHRRKERQNNDGPSPQGDEFQ